MAENKKPPIERKIVSASDAKASSEGAKTKKSAATAVADAPEQVSKQPQKLVKTPQEGKSSKGLRIGAIGLWVVAILFEIVAVLLLNRTLSLPGNLTTWLIVAIVVDLICVVIGSQLWKAANHIDPASEKNKIKFWLWNNMGVIVAVIAFFPLIILLLKNKDLDAKTKKLVTIIASVALLVAGSASYDFNPVSQEDQAAMKATALESMTSDGQSVYWTPFGKSYHLDQACSSLNRSATLVSGTLDEAFDAKRFDPCDFCAGGKDAKQDNPTTADEPIDVPVEEPTDQLENQPAEEPIEDSAAA